MAQQLAVSTAETGTLENISTFYRTNISSNGCAIKKKESILPPAKDQQEGFKARTDGFSASNSQINVPSATEKTVSRQEGILGAAKSAIFETNV